ncbi:MAG: MBL fold metallo-hydrolase, partial [Armatimonadetes bacterium]|nr:MBL fold metallo-hydrolase [Armatimonadota bacterium]
MLETGYCRVDGRVAYGEKERGKVNCYATCALLHHTEKGWLLFDTGYAPRVVEATHDFPYSLYAMATPLHIRPERAAVNQLPRLGLSPADIQTIVVSHFHADHIGGLLDFPEAVLVCSRDAYAAVAGLTGLAAVRRAFLPALMPPDFVERAVWTETLSATTGKPEHRDLFGDGSCVLVPLPGHAAGQIGLLAAT